MAANRNFRSQSGARNRGSRVMRRKINSVRRRRNIRKASPASSTSIGGSIATGIRTLTSFLPGQKIVRPVVDTLMKALGIISSLTLHGDEITASLNIIGLSTNCPLNFGNLMCECKNIGVQNINAQGLPSLTTNYDSGRVIKMIITAEPTAKYGERSGDWVLAIVPIKQHADRKVFENIIPNYEDLKNMPGARFGPATKPLSVVWIPNVVRDSASAMNQSFSDYDAFTYLMIAYSQEARSTYGNFSPDSFSSRFIIKTFAQFSERMPLNGFAGGSSTTLQPNAITPQSHYVGAYRGKQFHFTDEHVVRDTECIELKVSKSKHPELFQSLKASVRLDSLADDFESFSVVS